MARKAQEPEVIMKVTYVTDPANAQAAQDILKEGFRRALTKALAQRARKDKQEAV